MNSEPSQTTATHSTIDENAWNDLSAKLTQARQETAKVIFGQQTVIDNILITLISGGHVLLIGVPGLAKTLMVETISTAMGLDSARIQCTPDLMPSDILGSEVLEEDGNGKRSFRFIKGPVFTNFLMIDEINRASPRTQSALLQAMQEKHVSITGHDHSLPAPFHVLATQNPIEQEGTYPLPEAQLDRFLMQVDVEYPDAATEKAVILATTGNSQQSVNKVLTVKDLTDIQTLIRDIPVGEKVVDAILHIVRQARPDETSSQMVKDYVDWAPGPRASQALMLACRAKAFLDGRTAPSIDDVIDLALPTLKHRMALNYKATADQVSISDIITDLSKGV